jgi:hypothetical protein
MIFCVVCWSVLDVVMVNNVNFEFAWTRIRITLSNHLANRRLDLFLSISVEMRIGSKRFWRLAVIPVPTILGICSASHNKIFILPPSSNPWLRVVLPHLRPDSGARLWGRRWNFAGYFLQSMAARGSSPPPSRFRGTPAGAEVVRWKKFVFLFLIRHWNW